MASYLRFMIKSRPDNTRITANLAGDLVCYPGHGGHQEITPLFWQTADPKAPGNGQPHRHAEGGVAGPLVMALRWCWHGHQASHALRRCLALRSIDQAIGDQPAFAVTSPIMG